ncbi:helix-turn-helix transcriptional regulator [Arthrobacter sp. NIO-1057]|uniref:helix-turn-helix transcriptional regulator n=1 Tax=Arthrobacter sp. NIO-1057 TaxID=993071 RepID=UPI000945C2A1|nr:helix-turn-helix transcriptional regulator [Arthrobacter sp. NIO-1057]
MSIGEQIRRARTERGLSQTELANTASVSRATVARVESGRPISITTLTRLTAALEIRIELRAD